MQLNETQESTATASAPRYDTLVVRGAVGSVVPKEVDGGEVVSWSRGHELAAMEALEEFVQDLATDDTTYPAFVTERAEAVLKLMRQRRAIGWAAEAALIECPKCPFGPCDCGTARGASDA